LRTESPPWLNASVDYLPRWLEFQMRVHEQPGCVIAVGYRGRLVHERAFGPLTPRHRFRVASHSKSFTAAGILKLVERGRLRLNDPAGRYVGGLHPAIARATLAELLGHRAGVVRDGPDAGQFVDRRAFLNADELRAQLAKPPVLARNRRFKYSNHGYALVGLVIEAVTGEPYREWITREIVAAAGLRETTPDMPRARNVPFARGHTAKLPAGRRIIPGDFDTQAIAPAGGFVATAADLVRFYAQLDPAAPRSFLSAASRRAMTRGRWRDPHSSIERYYGLGVMSGRMRGHAWFGHSGGLQGYITRTAVMPKEGVAISVLTNSIDGLAHPWIEGAMHLIGTFARRGAPSRRLRAWRGRWWTIWNTVDLVPAGNRVLVAVPAQFYPLLDAPEIHGGRIALAGGYASHGEPAWLAKNELWLGGTRFVREESLSREMRLRYRAAS
jgi:CubicO group peptidase (beta-lactamase class C family)